MTTYVTPLVTPALGTGSQHTTVAVNASSECRKEPHVTSGTLLLLYVASRRHPRRDSEFSRHKQSRAAAHIIIRISSAGLGYVPLQHHSIRGLGKAQKVAWPLSVTQSHKVKVCE